MKRSASDTFGVVFVLLLLPRNQGSRPRQPRLDESEGHGS